MGRDVGKDVKVAQPSKAGAYLILDGIISATAYGNALAEIN